MPKRTSKDFNQIAKGIVDAVAEASEKNPAAVALHFMHYNFCRIHKSLRVTPAMEAGISSHVWEIGEIVDLLGIHERKAA